MINKTDLPRSKDAKRYHSLFQLEDSENLVKVIGCMKDRTQGTLYIGTYHLCFDSLNRAQKNTLKIPLNSILIIQQKTTLIKLKQHTILTLFTNDMDYVRERNRINFLGRSCFGIHTKSWKSNVKDNCV
jgi:hypothetical protein